MTNPALIHIASGGRIVFRRVNDGLYDAELYPDGTLIVHWQGTPDPSRIDESATNREKLLAAEWGEPLFMGAKPLLGTATEVPVCSVEVQETPDGQIISPLTLLPAVPTEAEAPVKPKRWTKPDLPWAPNFTPEDYLTYEEAAIMAGVAESTVTVWAHQGRVPAYRDPRSNRGRALIKRTDMEAYIREHKPKAKPRRNKPKEEPAVEEKLPKPTVAKPEPAPKKDKRARTYLKCLDGRMRPECIGCQYRTGDGCEKVPDPLNAPTAADGDCIWLGVRPGCDPRPEAVDTAFCRCTAPSPLGGRCMTCGRQIGVTE